MNELLPGRYPIRHGALVALAVTAFWSTGCARAATVKVDDPGELRKAVGEAKPGDVIRLAGGQYGAFVIRKVERGGAPITLVADDPASRPVFTSIEIKSSGDLTLKDLDVVLADEPGVTIEGSRRVRLEGLKVQGQSSADYIGGGNGIVIRRVGEVTVVDSELRNLGNGLTHRDTRKLTIRNNRIHSIRVDGIHGGGSSEMRIEGNTFWNFSRMPGEHPDAIQFWTSNSKESASDIVVENNLIIRGEGGRMQGIFITDQSKGRLPYKNVTVRGNAVIGSMYHGITVMNAVNPVVEDNVVLGYDDMKSWLMVRQSDGAIVKNNATTSLRLNTENKNLTESGNKALRQAKIGDARSARQWYARTRAALPSTPAELTVSMEPDPKDSPGAKSRAPRK
jgi:nitrous oxidase accessory protein NosD